VELPIFGRTKKKATLGEMDRYLGLDPMERRKEVACWFDGDRTNEVGCTLHACNEVQLGLKKEHATIGQIRLLADFFSSLHFFILFLSVTLETFREEMEGCKNIFKNYIFFIQTTFHIILKIFWF
jgi:hypothetical protein